MSKYNVPNISVIASLISWGSDYLIYCKSKGYRIATPTERMNKDPKHLYVSRGPILVKLGESLELAPEEECILLEMWATAVESAQRNEAYLQQLKYVQDIHYTKWLEDPINIDYRVPDELLREYNLL